MAVPLLHGEQAIGVLEVLDRPQDAQFTLAEMELLGLFGNQAAIALDLLRRARQARGALDEAGSEQTSAIARLATALERNDLDEDTRAAALRLLEALEDLL
jgi:GAF domain-containing protein